MADYANTCESKTNGLSVISRSKKMRYPTRLPFRIATIFLTLPFCVAVCSMCALGKASDPIASEDTKANSQQQVQEKESNTVAEGIKSDSIEDAESVPALINKLLSGEADILPESLHPPKEPGYIYQIAGVFFTFLSLLALIQVLVIDRRSRSRRPSLVTEKTLLISDLRILSTDLRLFKKILSVVSFDERREEGEVTKEKEMVAIFENLEATDFPNINLSEYLQELEGQLPSNEDTACSELDPMACSNRNLSKPLIDSRLEEIDRKIISSRLDSMIQKTNTVMEKIKERQYLKNGGLRSKLDSMPPTVWYRILITIGVAAVAFVLFCYIPSYPVSTIFILCVLVVIANLLVNE